MSGKIHKIAYLSNSKIPSAEANAVHVVKMCAAFTALGLEVSLFARKPRLSSSEIGEFYGVQASFETVYCPWPRLRGLGGWIYGRAVQRELARRAAPDLIYARDLYSLWFASRDGVPFIYEAHQPPATVFHRRLLGKILSRSGFVALVVISRRLGQILTGIYPGLPKEALVVAPDGADEVDMGAVVLERLLPGRSKALRVGYAGSFTAGRGIGLLLRVAGSLPRVDFHLFGGPDYPVKGYQRRAEHHENVHFHGFVPHAVLNGYLAQMDVLVAPYQPRVTLKGNRGDNSGWMSPLKIFEYMAVGKAIVCSDLPVIREVLSDGDNALLCPPRDETAWAEAIRFLGENPDIRRRLGTKARAIHAARFTWRQRCRKVLSVAAERRDRSGNGPD
ncbi:MAG: glycosyltransferase family 4 protein [Deltaproteobacteria bacterium]|nr:glycosyltransferase family 4 protein [Deltaproteobacteria bacterium]MBW1922867.1 glycosyltransferase family 4 protein [Deltaproteobacteria bacterium]MBW2007602.1 glycosyltransferase family 4 protein [Deltaproteobacteria bacterium]